MPRLSLQRLLPAAFAAAGLAVAFGALHLFDRAERLRHSEERATATLAAVVETAGLQTALAKEVALRAVLLTQASDPAAMAAADAALAAAIAAQDETLTRLQRQVATGADVLTGPLDADVGALVSRARSVERLARRVVAGEPEVIALTSDTDDLVARVRQMNGMIGASMDRWEREAHARQTALEGFAAILVTALVACCLFPILFMLQRRNRQLQNASAGLAAAAEELGVMSEMAQVAPWHIAPASGEVRWSERLVRLLGLSGAGAPSLPATLALFEPASAERLARVVARARGSGEGWDVELTTTAALGSRRMRCFGQAVREHGRMVSIACAMQDVTDGALARERYEAAQQRLAMATEGANIGLWDWSPDTDDAWYDDTWFGMLGYGPGELPATGTTWIMLVHPDDVPGALDRLERHLEGETPDYRAEFRMRTKDGAWRWILAVGRVAARDADGAAIRISGLHLDITERREAEAALAASEERFRCLTAMSSDWYWEQDADLRFVQFSHEIEGVWKVRAELLGKTRRELPIVLENTTWDEHQATLDRREPFRDLEYRIEDGGEPRWFRVSGDCTAARL